MSKWIDKSIKNLVEESVKKVQMARKTLTEDEINEIMPEVIKHFKQHANDREVFQDKHGGYILLIEIPEESKPKVTNSQFTEGEQWQVMCGSKLGFVSVFGAADEFWKATTEKGQKYFVRGSLKEQFDIKGTWGVGKPFSKRQYFKSLEEACKKTGFDIEDLDEDDVERTYTFNAWQNMG